MMKESILLINSHYSDFYSIALILEQAGYEVLKCHDLKQVEQVLKKQKIDLIIVDDQGPGFNVDTFRSTLNQLSPTSEIPFILLISFKKQVKVETLKKQQVLVLTKPILPYSLITMVTEALASESS